MKLTTAIMSLALLILVLLSTTVAIPFSSSALQTIDQPTKTLDTGVMAADDLLKRHIYYLDCGVMQTFCSQNGYFCDGNSYVRRQFNRLKACDQACSCRSLAAKPLVVTVVPCPQGSIFDFCKEVDGKVVENTETLGDAVESDKVESDKMVGDAVEFNDTV